jgi:glycosyltransferase involved in cell wall biosynthesis
MNRHRPFWSSRPVRLRADEVAAVYRRAHVGLCLSAAEGAMLASMQYLLVGLPVVTTPSMGGRDVFFDAENSITVEPEANAVAKAVAEWIERRPDPRAIRGRALERVAEHRERLRVFVRGFQASHGVPEERRLDAGWGRRAPEVFRPMVF